ncbi:MAG: hypothetical protein K2Y01_04780 [Rhabdochlamydiaceae bacterium]|nr:hypothetical protein [Rhabdochlamydiaceae bacterium]
MSEVNFSIAPGVSGRPASNWAEDAAAGQKPSWYTPPVETVWAKVVKSFNGFISAGTNAYTKVTTPVVERFNECVNDGTVRVTKGPLKGATVSEPSAVCGFVKDSSEKASSAYASAKAAANACIAEGEDYGRSVLPAGEEGPIDRPHRLCGFAKAANDGYITPGMASASSAWASFKGMFSGKIFGREVTGKDVGTVVAAVVAAVVTVKAVQWLMTPAKKKVSGFNLKF